jgi:serine/threonine protein kinase/Tol biopolymer transport system component
MDPERWQQIDKLLQSALARPLAERLAYLHRACAGDESLEREALSLLASHQEAGSFLEAPAMEVAAQGLAASASTPTTLCGRTISHYRIGEQLGQGGMGVVWKARDTALDRYVAFKVLSSAKMSDPEYKRRFVQEAKAASALNHPNIITVYEIGQAEGVDFIAMEFVPGKTLDQLIQRKGLRLAGALDYAIQVADALAAAHAAGIVHRDLKPGNLMVTESGVVKVLDFGLAKAAGHADMERTETIGDAPETATGVIVGTMSYMSPEQAEGKKVDARSDIFSFGAVLYEMLTGHRAFSGTSMLSILAAIMRDEPKPAAEIIQGLPRALDRIVQRCLRKDPGRRYQHAGDLKIDLQQVKEDLASGVSALSSERPAAHTRGWPWLSAAAVCLAISLGVGWWVRRPAAALHEWRLTRITNGAGLSIDAALSLDGKLVAYASDSGRDGGLDLFIKQVAGGQPIRLTSDGLDNRQPNFSPDGSKIVFRSNRDGVSGIYEIPAFGGQARLVARGGLRPRFSPDGSKVAYWVGSEPSYQTVPGTASVWVVPAGGGQPQRVGSNLTAARDPIWSADGKRLLLIGYTSAKLYDTSSLDWWMANPDGTEVVKTGAHDALIRAGLPADSLPSPSCWSTDTNMVLFSAPAGDARNLGEIRLSPRTGKVEGVPRRLTAGEGSESSPSCASSGALAFDNRESQSNIWFVPFDLNHGRQTGGLEQITEGPAMRGFPSLSKNGSWVAFFSNQAGQTNIWRRDLMTGNESMIAGSSLLQRYPVVSPSGAKIAFGLIEKDGTRTVYVASAGAEPEKVCEGCTRPTDWSSDERALLTYGGAPFQVDLLDLATHRQTPLLKHPTYGLLYGHFSPDSRWISFTVRTAPNRARFAIAPFEGPRPIPESAWITIADASIEDWAYWSPDGKTLYSPSGRDGHRCLWGQRIDPVAHRPVGEPFAAWHFHGRAFYQQDGWSTAGGRTVIVLRENTGNIWLMSRPGPR